MDARKKFIPAELTKRVTAREAYAYCGEFTAFFLLLLYVLTPAAAFVLSFILRFPAAFLLHDFFMAIGAMLIAFALAAICFAARGANLGSVLRYVRRKPQAAFFALFLVWAGISALLAEDLETAFWGTAFRYNGFFTYMVYSASAVACSNVKSGKLRKLLLFCFAGVSVVLCLVMLGQNYGLEFITSINGSRNQSVFLNPNHFGYFLAMSIVLLGGATVCQTRILPAATAGLLFVFEAWVLTLNDTFGAQVAVFLALLLMPPAYRLLAARRRTLISLIPLVLFSAVYVLTGSLGAGRRGSDAISLLGDAKSIIGGVVSGGQAQTEKRELANGDRFSLWVAAAGYAAEKPVLGWGPDSLGPLFEADGFKNTAAHNEYIQLAAETGFPGLLFYLAGLASVFAVNLKAVRSAYYNGGVRLSPYSVVAAGSALSYLISAFFGVSLSYTASFCFVLLPLGSICIEKDNMS